MKELTGFAPATDGCACEICRVLRSHSAPLEFELSDTLPAKTDPNPDRLPVTLDDWKEAFRRGQL